MKNKYYIILSVILLVISSCNAPRLDKEETLFVSIEPQKFFLQSIVGDRFEVISIIPEGSNPETFDPAPSQMVALGKSKMYFKVGRLGFENVWLENLKKNNPGLIIVDCSKGIDILEHDCHEHEHEHGGHGHADGDPHIWSSPATASLIAKNMYEAIIGIDKENEEYYKKNYTKLLSGINHTDSVIRHYLDKAQSRSFVIYHPALSFFSREYGLEQLPMEYDGKNPSPSQLKSLVDLAKDKEVKVVFIQKEFDKKNAETIAKELDAEVVPINLLSYYWSEEMIKVAKSLAGEYE